MKVVFLISLFFISRVLSDNPRVRTQLGTIEGFTYNNSDGTSSHIFLGIRYAKAPIGELRFEKPMPYPEWKDVYEAKTFPKACIPVHPSTGSEEFSEDCLFLNIIRPAGKPKDPQGFPVLVYIHGGGFSDGNTAEHGYKSLSENFANQDIIVVTIQYRLGPFGFFSTGDKVLPGNIGLWDQMYALYFLNQFLPNFNGNIFKITVMGHSAGAASVHALAMSPQSVDLFQRAIQLSGTLFAEWAMNDHVIENSLQLADAVGCDSTKGSVKIHDCMKTKSVDEIHEGIEKLGVYKQHVREFLFTPRFDGEFLPQSTELLMKGAPEIPTVFTLADAEASNVINKDFDPLKNPLGIDPEAKKNFDAREFQIYIADHAVEYEETGRAGGGFRTALYEYFVDKDVPKDPDPSLYLHRVSQFVGDLMFTVPTIQQLEIRNSLNHRSYLLYEKHARRQKNPGIVKGAHHLNKLYYIFDKDFEQDFEFDEADKIFQTNLLEMIRNFTVNGVPRSSGTDWPSTNRKTKHVVLNPGLTIEDKFEPERMNFWLEELPQKVGVKILQKTRLPHAELHQKHTEL